MPSAGINLNPPAAEYAYLSSIFNLSAAVILYYNYVLTLPQEIEFLWPPRGWFTLACLLNRYLSGIPRYWDFHAYHKGFMIALQALISDSAYAYHHFFGKVTPTAHQENPEKT
ncbi:hypothetical protein BGW80DRAFT_1258670 [Lactifluus volemus]|nr:hypothetical protein BGW80DRAFT_1258670 [Lactifluus volemus]